MNKIWSRDDSKFFPASETVERLPAGYYSPICSQGINGLESKKVITDGLLDLPDSITLEILAEFDKFWQLREKFKQRNLLHKRGVMLFGPPGTGKTSAINQMTLSIIKNNGIVVNIQNPTAAANSLAEVRKIEPDRPIVGVMEDFDSLIALYKESGFLALLDGETQIDHIVYLATTNNIRQIPKRFIDRPSRFDLIREIGIPSDEARRHYLLARDPTIKNVDLWVEHSHTFSIAHLREMIILVQCFDVPVIEAANRIHAMRKGKLIISTEEQA